MHRDDVKSNVKDSSPYGKFIDKNFNLPGNLEYHPCWRRDEVIGRKFVEFQSYFVMSGLRLIRSEPSVKRRKLRAC